MLAVVFLLGATVGALRSAMAQAPANDLKTIPRCEVVPQPDHQVVFKIDGIEKLVWHFGDAYPRPFFYPLRGPSGASLTRMGHPGAPNHDHHQSIWFAHNQVNGLDFWGYAAKTRIRQKSWLAYEDGDQEAVMAVQLGWFDQNEKQILDQETIAALIPLADGEHALEIQMQLQPLRAGETVQLGKTNFGLLAVRVAKSISENFGDGVLTNSEGQKGEEKVFGKQARWMDYSGSVVIGKGDDRKKIIEGITFIDHSKNLRYPTAWHVRQDGWMGAAFGLHEGLDVSIEKPLTLRYLLYAHAGPCNEAKIERVADQFDLRPAFQVLSSKRPHRQFDVRRN